MTSSYMLAILDAHLERPDPDRANELIRYFHERLQESREVDEQLHRDDAFLLEKYMTHVFAQIRAGVPEAQALGLKLGRSKGSEDNTDRDLSLAAFAILQRRSGKTWEEAIGSAAEAFDVSESTAQRAYKQYRDGLGCLPDHGLQALAV